MAFGALRGTLAGSDTNPGTTVAASGSVSVSIGDLVVVNLSNIYTSYALTGINFTDNLGNVYNILPILGSEGTSVVQMLYAGYAYVTVSGTLTAVTATWTSSSGSDAAISVAVYEGTFEKNPLDIYVHPVLTDSTSPYTCPATGTLNAADELIIGMQSQSTGATAGSYGAASGYTLDVSASTGTGASTTSCGIVSKVVTTTTTTTPGVTTGADQSGRVSTLTFFKSGATISGGTVIGGLMRNVISNTSTALATYGACYVEVGDLVVASWMSTNNILTGVSDNLGNTYSEINSGSSSGDTFFRLFYSRVTTAGWLTNVEYASTSTSSRKMCVVGVFKGPFKNSPLDVHPSNATDTSTPYVCPASGTLAQTNELVVCTVCGDQSSDPGEAIKTTSPLKLANGRRYAWDSGTSDDRVLAMGYNVVSSTSSVQYEFSQTSGTFSTNEGFTSTSTFKLGTDSLTRSFGAIFG